MKYLALLMLFVSSFLAAAPLGWGVVAAKEVPAFNESGSPATALPAGTIFNIVERGITINDQPALRVEIRKKIRLISISKAIRTFDLQANESSDQFLERTQKQFALSKQYREQPLALEGTQPKAVAKEETPAPASTESTDAAQTDAVGWGITAKYQVNTFTKEAKPGPKLNGGTCFKVIKDGLNVTITDAKGEQEKCPAAYIETLDKTKQRVIVLKDENCKFFQGSYINETQREAVTDYYTAIATRDRFLETRRDAHLRKSPVKDLPAKKAALAKIPERDRELEAKMNAAKKNNDRLRYRDARKELKYEAIGLQDDIRRMEEIGDSWLVKNPFDENAIKKTAVYKRLNARVQETYKIAAPWVDPGKVAE